MKESYNRQANYPIGKPFTTDVIRDTLKNVERKSENNRYSSLGNLMPSVSWPVTVTGEYSDGLGGTESDIFRVRINSAGTVDLLDLLGSQIKFYPTLTYPAALDDPSTYPGSEHGGTAIPTSFATYVAGTSPNRSSFTIYPRADIASFGDMYIKDVVFTVAHDGALAPGTITCIADSNSKELLPNNQYVYYSWTLTYATGVTVDDIHTYLTSGVPTLFAAYFYCSKKNEGVTATMPAATTKNLFFMTQGLTLGMDQIVTQRLLTGLEYVMTADLNFADYHELVVYIKIPYGTDTRDSVTYYSHMEKFPKSSYAALSTSNILFSWEMTTEECDMSSLIPFAYRENDGTLIFIDGTRFYKSKLNNGDFKPLSGTRTFELGGFAIFNADGALYDVNSLGDVGEMDLVNEDGAGYYNLSNKIWWYATDESYTFYRHDSGAPRPAFAVNRTSGQVLVGGGTDQVSLTEIQSPYNTHAMTTLVPVGESLLTIYASDGVAGLRSALLYGQNGQTNYSALVHLTQTDGTSDPGMYMVTHLDKLFIGLHNHVSSNMLVTGALEPYVVLDTNGVLCKAGTPQIEVRGPGYPTGDRNQVVITAATSSYLTVTPTAGVLLRDGSGYIRAKDAGNTITSDYSTLIECFVGSNHTKLDTALTYVSGQLSVDSFVTDTSEWYLGENNAHVACLYNTGATVKQSFFRATTTASSGTTVAQIFGGSNPGGSNGVGTLVEVTPSEFVVRHVTDLSQLPVAQWTSDEVFLVANSTELTVTYRSGAIVAPLEIKHTGTPSSGDSATFLRSTSSGLLLIADNITNILDGKKATGGLSGTSRVILTSFNTDGASTHSWGALRIDGNTLDIGFGTNDISAMNPQWDPTKIVTTIDSSGNIHCDGDITALGMVEASGFGIETGPSGATSASPLVFDQNGGGTITLEIYGGIITSITVAP